MLNLARRFLSNAPRLALFPGVAIFLTVMLFNLLGDGLRDALGGVGSSRLIARFPGFPRSTLRNVGVGLGPGMGKPPLAATVA
jgi:hypothetical protein